MILRRRGYSVVGGKQGNPRLIRLGWMRWVALGFVFLVLLCPVFLPYAALLNAALSRVATSFVWFDTFTLHNIYFVFVELSQTALVVKNTFILGIATLFQLGALHGASMFGTSWTIVAGYLFTVGHFCLIMAVATHFYGVRRGVRHLHPFLGRLSQKLTLEGALIAGVAMVIVSLAALATITVSWSSHGFVALPSILPLTLAAVLGTVGIQTALGGFLLAIIADNNARLAPRGANGREFWSQQV